MSVQCLETWGPLGGTKSLSRALLAVHVFSTPVERSFFSGGAQYILIKGFTMADLTYSTRRLSQPAVFDWQNQRASWRLKITSLGALGVVRWLGDRFFRFTVEPPFSLHRKKKKGNALSNDDGDFRLMLEVYEYPVI